jgi:hypothetical protein
MAPQAGAICVCIGINLAILGKLWAVPARATLSLAPLSPRLTKLHTLAR